MDDTLPGADSILLITGSRQATPEMKVYVARVVRRAYDRGWRIIVGDAEGVDTQVARTILRTPYDDMPFQVFGITRSPRLEKEIRSELPMDHYAQVDIGNTPTRQGFPIRDKYMVDRADCCIAIWNGYSSGTRLTFRYAQQKKIPTWVIDFKEKR